MYKKKRRIVRRRPVVRRRGRGIGERVKQVAKYAIPIAAALGANKLIHGAFKTDMGSRVASRVGNYAFDKAKDYITRELARRM